MTEYEKRIYNAYLGATKRGQDLPYKLRQNFVDFEDTGDYALVQRLVKFFSTRKQIDVNEFFSAPYEIYDDMGHLTLKDYVGLKACNWYTTYKAETVKTLDDPDTIKKILESFKFIIKFCRKNNIKSVEDYVKFQETGKMYPSYILHVKNGEVIFQVFFGYLHFEKYFYQIPRHELKLILGDIILNMST